MKTVTRVEIANEIYKEIGLSHKDSDDILDGILAEIEGELAAGNDVKLSAFGTFSVRKKHARIGRNPKTGVSAEICPRTVISFKPSQMMRKAVNA